MKSKIVTEVIDFDMFKESLSFSDNLILVVKTLLDEGLWISGGFARNFYHYYVNKYKAGSVENKEYFFNSFGDIDFFCSDYKVRKKSLETISRVLKEKINNNIESTFLNYSYLECYLVKSRYANNIKLFIDHLNTEEEMFKEYKLDYINIQIIDTCFKSIYNMFNHFDFTNSKYCILKMNNKYCIKYTKKALEYDNLKILDICYGNTPFLAKRINKYLLYKGLERISENSRKHIKDYFFNILAQKWSVTPNPESFYIYQLNRLDSLINLEKSEISILLGVFDVITEVNCDSEYNFSHKIEDWAILKIKDEIDQLGNNCR